VLKQDVLVAAGVVMIGVQDYRMVDDEQNRRLPGITLLGFQRRV
jgi:hypothetical protein